MVGIMKRIISLLLLTLAAVSLQAQDFDLYFANNVGDVTNLRNIKTDPNLNWKKIEGSSVSSNRLDVENVMRMFKETRQKNRDDQKLFWKMRDDNLLCFRINDGKGTSGEYEARVRIGQRTVMKNVSSFFFVNTQSETDSLYVSVCRKGCGPNDTLRFTYFIYSWDNDGLLVFKLDSKRRKSGGTYQLEYQLMGKDEKVGGAQRLGLSGNSFQSFYVHADSCLKDLFLVTEGNRLRLDQTRLVWGANLNNRLNRLWIGTNFTLDKHENRELTIFNMLGSGLFENYDTLHLQVLGKDGKPIIAAKDATTKLAKGFTFNIFRVDEKGQYVNDDRMKYVGYDSKRGIHKLLTNGHPAYVEVIATGYYPALYKYAGPADPKTKVLSKEHNSGVVRLIEGTATQNGPNISKQMVYVLKDKKEEYGTDNNKQYYYVVDSCDLSTKSSSSSYTFIEDGGRKTGKIWHPSKAAVDKFAEIGIVYSVAKTAGAAAANEAKLFIHEKGAADSIQLQTVSSNFIDANDYPGMQYSYFTQRYNLVGKVSKEETDYKLRLVIDKRVFKHMPYIRRRVLDVEKKKKEAKKEAERFMYLSWKPEGDKDISLNLLGNLGMIDLKFPEFPGFALSVSPTIDVIKNIYEIDINFSLGWRSKKLPNGDTTTGQKMRDNQKDVMNPSRFEIGKPKIGGHDASVGVDAVSTNPAGNILSDIKKRNMWFMSEMDDIFKVEANKLGYGPYVDGQIGFGWNFSKENLKSAFYIKTIQVTGGIGAAAAYSFDALEELFGPISFPIAFVLHANASGYLQGTAGLKTYNYVNDKKEIYDRMYGAFLTGELTVKAGFGLMLKSQGRPANASEETEASWFTRLLKVSAGARAGVKGSVKYGFVWPFEKRIDQGGSLLLMGAAELYFDVASALGTRFRARLTGKVGGYKFWDDAADNPMVPSYPNYIPEGKAPALGPSMAPQWPSLTRSALRPRLTADSESQANDFSFGELMLEQVGYDSKPFFMGEGSMLINHQNAASNLNDDRLMEFTLPDPVNGEQATLKIQDGKLLPNNGHRMQRPHLDSNGDIQIAVCEEMTRDITAQEMAAENMSNEELQAMDIELARHNRIVASRKVGNGQWQQQQIAYDENLVDVKPVVALQIDSEDYVKAYQSDHAACIWQRGQFRISEEEKLREAGVCPFGGDLMLSVFDGTQWGEPQSIMKIEEEDLVKDYRLLMRNDTVLAIIQMLPKGSDEVQLRYLCKPLNGPLQAAVIDSHTPEDFSVDMVGGAAFIGILHRADSLGNDIYVKEINMRGEYTGYGIDLDIAHYNPESVRLVSDHVINMPHDFAVVWTKSDNTIRQGGERAVIDHNETIINCSRLFLGENLQATPYITLGCSVDSLLLTNYDVSLNNMQATVLYTLSDPKDKTSCLMRNQVEFYDDFNYAISYPLMAMLDTETMPININIYNTGDSPITEVYGYINDQEFSFKDIFINPFSIHTLTMEYPIPENFDGFLKAHDVTAVFAGGWSQDAQASMHRAADQTVKKSNNNDMQLAQGFADVSCQLLSQTMEGAVNKLYVEVTDNSANRLNENFSVHVGLYPNSVADVPLSSASEMILKASDFEEVAGQRKAYVELIAENLEEETEAWLRARVYNDRIAETLTGEEDDPLDAIVENLSWRDNLHLITLLPSELDDATGMPVVTKDLSQRKVQVTRQEKGVLVTGLEQGDFVRIFDAAALPVYQHSQPSNSVFVPLTRHGVYLLSTGQEVFKFTF